MNAQRNTSILGGVAVLTGWCLVGAAFAQAQTTPDNTNPALGPPSQTQDVPGAGQHAPPNPANPVPSGTTDQANSATYPDPEAAASMPHQNGSMRSASAANTVHISNGMDVESQAGQQMGTVVSVVPTSTGRPGYVIVADPSGTNTAIPYGQARQLVRGNKVVVSGKRLREAPKVSQSRLLNSADRTWENEADHYWKRNGGTRSGLIDRG